MIGKQVTDGVRLRPFVTEDWPALLEIANRLFPDSPRSLEGALHWDSRWQTDKHFRERLVAESVEGRVVGSAALTHMPWQFSPDKYRFHAEVDPELQRRGIGSLLFEALLRTAQARGATLMRSEAKESMTASLEFLRNRGFEEIQRFWESRLDVTGFDFSPFATAEPRAAEQGFEITTLAAELRAAGEADADTVLRKLYDLGCECSQDEPSFDQVTMPPYKRWRDDTLAAPNVLHDAFFLMRDGERYVGLSELTKNLVLPEVLQQQFTAVARSHRGKGVAMALKIRGVRYARERGYTEIRTGNNTRNRPMLRINEAMGFVKQPMWIEFGKSL